MAWIGLRTSTQQGGPPRRRCEKAKQPRFTWGTPKTQGLRGEPSSWPVLHSYTPHEWASSRQPSWPLRELREQPHSGPLGIFGERWHFTPIAPNTPKACHRAMSQPRQDDLGAVRDQVENQNQAQSGCSRSVFKNLSEDATQSRRGHQQAATTTLACPFRIGVPTPSRRPSWDGRR